jgi:hypothetical protein
MKHLASQETKRPFPSQDDNAQYQVDDLEDWSGLHEDVEG